MCDVNLLDKFYNPNVETNQEIPCNSGQILPDGKMKIMIDALLGFVAGGIGIFLLFLLIGGLSNLHDRIKYPYTSEKIVTKKSKK